MFDFLGATSEQVNQSNQAHAVNYLALALVLIDKGIMSYDDIRDAVVRATHLVEQEWAMKKEEAIKDLEQEYPGVRELFRAW